MYTVVAMVEDIRERLLVSHQVPTFFLDENLQGIVDDEHAIQIAKAVINPTNDSGLVVHVSVYKN